MNDQELVRHVNSNHEKMFVLWDRPKHDLSLLKVVNQFETVDAIDLNSGSIPVVIIERECQVDVIDEWNLECLGEVDHTYMGGSFGFYQLKEQS